jgi:hypothetical protein
VGHLQRHLDTWPQLRPDEPVSGGVLVVNHQHRRHPSERTARVYSRPEIVDALTVPVLDTVALFNWACASPRQRPSRAVVVQVATGGSMRARPGPGQGMIGTARQAAWPSQATPDDGEQASYVGWRGLAVAAGLAVHVSAARLAAARRVAGSSKRYGAAFGKAVSLRGVGSVAAGAAM